MERKPNLAVHERVMEMYERLREKSRPKSTEAALEDIRREYARALGRLYDYEAMWVRGEVPEAFLARQQGYFDAMEHAVWALGIEHDEYDACKHLDYLGEGV